MEHKYYMFYKPARCITAKSDERHRTVMEYFKEVMEQGLHPVGRLDKDTEGILLVTTDGDWNQRLMHPEYHVAKRYEFYALGVLGTAEQKRMEKGLMLVGEEVVTKPCEVWVKETMLLKEALERLPTEIFSVQQRRKLLKNPMGQGVVRGEMVITEGRKHQVKRMLKACGCYCIYLKRNAIGGVVLDERLKKGEFRELTQEELKKL